MTPSDPRVISDGANSVVIHEVVDGNTARLDALIDIYMSVLAPYASYVDHMRQYAARPANADPRFVEHQWLAEVNGKPAGITQFKYVPQRNCGLGFALGVLPEFRTFSPKGYLGLGQMLNRLSVDQLAEDARAMGRPAPVGLVVEVEAPQTTDDATLKAHRVRLLARYGEYGDFHILPVDYYEPPDMFERPDQIETNQALYDSMVLGVFALKGTSIDRAAPATIADCVRAILIDHYGLPEDHWAVRRGLGLPDPQQTP